jgi:hypothetical protein
MYGLPGTAPANFGMFPQAPAASTYQLAHGFERSMMAASVFGAYGHRPLLGVTTKSVFVFTQVRRETGKE